MILSVRLLNRNVERESKRSELSKKPRRGERARKSKLVANKRLPSKKL